MRSLLVLAAALASGGCLQLVQSMSAHGGRNGGPSTTASDGSHRVAIDNRVVRVGPYWGPDCVRIEAPTNGRLDEATLGKQPNLAHDLKDQIFRLVCVERIFGSGNEPERDTWVMQHFRFDELDFDHFTAAMMIVECLESESCLDEGAPKVKPAPTGNPQLDREMAEQAARPRSASSYYEVGMMRWYAERVDTKLVAARLATLAIPSDAQRIYLALLDKAKARVIAVSDELAPTPKHLFVEIPEEIHAQHAADVAKHAKLVADLAGLTAHVKTERVGGTVSDATVDQLRTLRIGYHATCRADCTHDAIFLGITRQLFWAYVSRADGPAAMAEAKLLEHADPSPQVEIAKQQSDAIQKAIGRGARVAQARQQGIDADSARSTAAGSVVDLGDGRYVYHWADDFKIYYEQLVPDGNEVGQATGKVAGLERKGDRVLVRFSDELSSTTESTNCHETNRVDRIESDGNLVYRQDCTGSETHYDRRKVAPVTLPANEAANLHGGDEVVAFTRGSGDARTGRIWMVKRGAHVARLRDVPL